MPAQKYRSICFKKQMPFATAGGLGRTENALSRPKARPTKPALRIGTPGKTKSIVASHRTEHVSPRLLSMKSAEEKTSLLERRSFISFDLTDFDCSSEAAAQLRLSLVPCNQGLAV
jgi:hypothetical protein